MLSIEDIEKEEKNYKIIKLNKEEIRLLGILVANKIIENKQKIEEYRETDEIKSIDKEMENQDYINLLHILEYLER